MTCKEAEDNVKGYKRLCENENLVVDLIYVIEVHVCRHVCCNTYKAIEYIKKKSSLDRRVSQKYLYWFLFSIKVYKL